MLITIPDDVDFFDPVTDLRTFFLFNSLISPKKPNINASLKLINFFSGTTKIDFTLLLIFILSIKYLLNVPPPVKRTEEFFLLRLIITQILVEKYNYNTILFYKSII